MSEFFHCYIENVSRITIMEVVKYSFFVYNTIILHGIRYHCIDKFSMATLYANIGLNVFCKDSCHPSLLFEHPNFSDILAFN